MASLVCPIVEGSITSEFDSAMHRMKPSRIMHTHNMKEDRSGRCLEPAQVRSCFPYFFLIIAVQYNP
jgi:hypothetical protein